jgi:hypothetical protein
MSPTHGPKNLDEQPETKSAYRAAELQALNLHDEYARANLDRRHVLELSTRYLHELPLLFTGQTNFKEKVLGGWQYFVASHLLFHDG